MQTPELGEEFHQAHRGHTRNLDAFGMTELGGASECLICSQMDEDVPCNFYHNRQDLLQSDFYFLLAAPRFIHSRGTKAKLKRSLSEGQPPTLVPKCRSEHSKILLEFGE